MNLKSNKLIILVVLLGLLAMTFVGCSKPVENPQGETPQEGAFKPGTYTAEADGIGGAVKVSVTVDANSITEVKIVENNETKGIADAALTKIPEAIVTGQTLAVDTVSGATVTSNAILTAVEEALKQAGADIEALKVAKASTEDKQDMTYDTEVVVIGGGAAGLSAALEAANNGAKVMLVEKLAMTGGSTARSGGKILVPGTDLQKANGVTDDTPELYFNHLMSVSENKADEDKLRLISNNGLADYNWLVENGVEFSKNIEQLHAKYKPMRGHYVSAQDGKTEHDGHGWAITQPLEAKAKEKGVEILFETPATKLITNAAGEVVGVECENAAGNKVTINAKAVILATGGYDLNKELLAEYAPLVQPVYSTVGTGNTGDGLIMAREIGAKIESGGGAVMLYMDLAARVGEVGGLYVDATGSRFVDESDFWFSRTKALIDREQTMMYYITDATKTLDNFESLVEAGKIIKADTIEEIQTKLGMANLTATVDRYNTLSKNGKDEDFNKKAELMIPVEKGPFYAIAFAPITSGTFGGPVTNIDAQVIREDGSVIKGLYAAGEVANGDIFISEYPGSGSSISACVAFGRVAGRVAAAEAASQR